MKIGPNGVGVMHYFESCKLEAYPDPGSEDGRPWTIGWGHTGPEVVKGLRWSQEQADAAFLKDIAQFEQAVSRLVTVPVSQGQFDALVSFAYNVGTDEDADNIAEGLGDSTLLRLLNGLDYTGAAEQFAKWNKNGGKVMRGLTRRRAAERALWQGKNADDAIKIGAAAA